MTIKTYPELAFDLSNLNGISDAQLDVHFKLYAGYVANTNKLNSTLEELEGEGKAGTPLWAEMKRRAGWEYNGKILHELYFGGLKSGGSELSTDSAIGSAMAE